MRQILAPIPRLACAETKESQREASDCRGQAVTNLHSEEFNTLRDRNAEGCETRADMVGTQPTWLRMPTPYRQWNCDARIRGT